MSEYANLKLLNVLYVDDDLELCMGMQKILSLLVQNVYIASTGSQALDIFTRHRMDIIILDIRMGETNGIELAQQLRHSNKNLPIVIVSSYAETEELLAACKLKLIDYLRKPVDLHSIIKILTEAFSQIRENGELLYFFTDEITYNYLSKSLTQRGKEIYLTKNEIVVLELLMAEKGKIVSYESIFNVLDVEMTDGALKSLMLRLRKKIGEECIRNLSKIGYMLL